MVINDVIYYWGLFLISWARMFETWAIANFRYTFYVRTAQIAHKIDEIMGWEADPFALSLKLQKCSKFISLIKWVTTFSTCDFACCGKRASTESRLCKLGIFCFSHAVVIPETRLLHHEIGYFK